MSIRFTFLVLLLATGRLDPAGAQQIAAAPEGWIAVSPPPEGGQAQCANWAFDEWIVTSEHPGVRFHRDTRGKWTDLRGSAWWVNRSERPQQTAQVADGRLTAVNRGEFGGTVSWHSNDNQRIQAVAETNLVAFIPTSTGLFGLTGLAHGSNYGALVHFDRGLDSQWRMRTVTDLGAAPQAYIHINPTTLLVALSGALQSVELGGLVTVLHRNPLWSKTYPNSIAVDADGRIYVGIRSAIARLSRSVNGLIEDWLVTADCTRRAAHPGPMPLCECL